MLDTLQTVDLTDRAAWRDWLAAHHTQPEGVWLVLYNKASGRRLLTYEEAVEEALCFGWIDSLPRKLNEASFKLLFTPRKKGSGWSAVNKRRLEKLEAAGMLMPAGLAKIAAAKQDGSWTSLDAAEALEMPEDLTQALAANPTAQANFAAFPPSARKQILQYLSSARRPETRQQRLARVVARAADNLRL